MAPAPMVMILVIFIGMILVAWQEKVYHQIDGLHYEVVLNEINRYSLQDIANRYDDVLIIRKDGDAVYQRYTPENIRELFLNEHLFTGFASDYNISGKASDYSILFSKKKTYRPAIHW